MKFGRLTVIKRAEDYVSPKGYVALNWECECDCGQQAVVRGCNLKSGASQSCGCKRVLQPNRTIHGGKGTRLYTIWKSMKNRCENENEPSFVCYGARGIRVCEEWSCFDSFRDWAMSNGYRDDLSIDRIDNDKGYYPDNCRWATLVEQANNKRNNHMLTFNGETHTMSQWAEITGISYQKLKDRINKCKWSIEKALTTP